MNNAGLLTALLLSCPPFLSVKKAAAAAFKFPNQIPGDRTGVVKPGGGGGGDEILTQKRKLNVIPSHNMLVRINIKVNPQAFSLIE